MAGGTGRSMKWVYGKQDWKTFERGLENCYLMTNGLGGFSSLTMTGAAARGDHAFFMACTEAPNHRYNMIQRLEEEITAGGENYLYLARSLRMAAGRKGFTSCQSSLLKTLLSGGTI